MTALEERNNESAERIKTLMFTFDDLTRLDSARRQTLIRTPGTPSSVALKGASDRPRELFLGNMSDPRRQDPQRGHAGDGPRAAARRRGGPDAILVNLAKELAAKGDDDPGQEPAKKS